jgi:hypothetical protein
MPSDQTTRIPHVPLRSPMFVGQDGLTLTRPWVIFFERLASVHVGWEDPASLGELKATFGLVKELEVAYDLTNHFICRTGGRFLNVAVNAKLPPAGAPARLDIQRSVDGGVQWTSIFRDGYIELAANNSGVQIYTDVFVAGEAGTIQPGHLLRINCYQTGTDFPGKEIEVVLRWE